MPATYAHFRRKTMRPRNMLLTAVIAALCVFQAPGQGLYVESKGSSGGEIERFWYMPHMFRSMDGNGNVTVIRLDREVIYSFDPAKRTYTEMHFSDMKAMREKVAAMTRKRMESMPPEQRKAFEERMSGAAGGSEKNSHEVVSTGDTRSISGFTCSKYIVKRNGKQVETVWASNDILGAESMRKDMEKFMETVSTNLGNGRRLGTAWYKEVRGLPIQTESDGSTRTITKVEQRPVPPSEFEIPAGYTKTNPKGFDDSDHEGGK
jgi:hypothetical protein